MEANEMGRTHRAVKDFALAALLVSFCLLAIWPARLVAIQAGGELPTVLVIGTGGTISGQHPEAGTLGGGYSTTRPANDLVADIPIVARFAHVETEQFSDLGSPSITPTHWLGLARRINEVFAARPEVSGVVVTHGTASLEQTAFFLHLTVKSERSVVVVGAQRPSTGIGSDGPHNLVSGVRVAASPAARNRGVMVVMDGRITSARDVEKVCRRTGCFHSGNGMGVLGIISDDVVDGVRVFYAPLKKHTTTSDFDISGITTLPRVDIMYSYAGAERDVENGLPDPEAEGVIVVTTGFAPGEREYYTELRRQGIIVATTYPSGDDMRFPREQPPLDQEGVPRVVIVPHLTPFKARILMMLALTKTRSAEEIQEIFWSY